MSIFAHSSRFKEPHYSTCKVSAVENHTPTLLKKHAMPAVKQHVWKEEAKAGAAYLHMLAGAQLAYFKIPVLKKIPGPSS